MLETEVKKLNKNLELLNTNFATLFSNAGLSTADPIEEADLAAAAAIQPAAETAVAAQVVQQQPVQQSIPQMQQQPAQATQMQQQPMVTQQQQPMQQLPITQQQPAANPQAVQTQAAQAPAIDPGLASLMVTASQVSGDALLVSKLLGQLGVTTVEQLDINGLATLQSNLQAIISNAQGGTH